VLVINGAADSLGAGIGADLAAVVAIEAQALDLDAVAIDDRGDAEAGEVSASRCGRSTRSRVSPAVLVRGHFKPY
jgi:hypothetical protein